MEYLVEVYMEQPTWPVLAELGERLRRAGSELNRQGTAVNHVRSILVPEDETCFLLYEAESTDAVARAARLARVPFERIVAAHSAQA